ncbi:MAG: hypothetical protein JSV62_01575 [Promethearchaeota archaeon]|nr:MAG: hypothetical protein JSV62_01575 [Candidatus Lokiarchaeota archaeon]
MKKGPVCYVYYAIKNKRQSKLERERELLEKKEKKELHSEVEIYNSH